MSRKPDMPKQIIEGVCPECGETDPKKMGDTDSFGVFQCATCNALFRPHFKEIFDGHEIWDRGADRCTGDWNMVKLIPATPAEDQKGEVEITGEQADKIAEAFCNAARHAGFKEPHLDYRWFYNVLMSWNPQPEQGTESEK